MSQLISHYPLAIYSIVSITIFMGLFAAVLFWLFKIETPESLKQKSLLPFDDLEPKS